MNFTTTNIKLIINIFHYNKYRTNFYVIMSDPMIILKMNIATEHPDFALGNIHMDT